MTGCSEEALDRAAHIQGDYTSDSQFECYVCGRKAQPMRSLILSDHGWVCAIDDFCRAGTSEERHAHS